MEVKVRPLETVEEFEACERLQRRVWAMPDNLDVVPLHLLISAQRNGALVLGAFEGSTLVGLLFGYLGVTSSGLVKHCSHMMGVAPEAQGSGVGFLMKLAQREFALGQGCDLVTWTYDPLESRNANLNIRKLGAVCRSYFRDYYGPMDDGLNRGLPSDRFQVDWWLTSDRVRVRLAGESPACPRPEDEALLEGAVLGPEPAAPGHAIPCQDASRMWVEIPASFQALRVSDPGLAATWRFATRSLFEDRFAAGFAVTDFALRHGRAFYLLTKEPEENAHRPG